MDKYRDLLNLSYVQRWVIAPMARPQSVAEHSYRVAVLVRAIHACCYEFDVERAILLAMDHDAAEVFTGDMPGVDKDTKHKWPAPSTMLNFEVAVKVADALESWYWWYLHGDKTWNHPQRPRDNCDNRDIRKMRWYCQDSPGLLQAVRTIMIDCLNIPEVVVPYLLPSLADAPLTTL